MIFSSLALVLLAAIPNLGSHVHMHPLPADGRVEITLVNHGTRFCDIKVDGRSYEVGLSHSVTIKAPAGTLVYLDSAVPFHKRGDVLVALMPELNKTTMNLN